jgi:2-polyprenyl-3-methyl-5-hydroxy-6-metoxy-1,4-benzoquinol methylase
VARILAFGRQGLAGRRECSNIASDIGVAQYVAIAAEISAWTGTGRVLDWGAGWGQTSLLLHAQGVGVVAYDIEDKGAAHGLLGDGFVSYVVTPGPGLPFPDGAFDAVLNCGVLEHVEDEPAALDELRRVLRPGGRLFTYHLPNRHAWTEALGRALGRFHHERTYTRAEAMATFSRAGLRVVRCRPYHVLPRNVWGRLAPRWVLGGPASRLYEHVDRWMEDTPLVGRLATAWALVAERP